MKKYLRQLSAAIMNGTLRVKIFMAYMYLLKRQFHKFQRGTEDNSKTLFFLCIN